MENLLLCLLLTSSNIMLIDRQIIHIFFEFDWFDTDLSIECCHCGCDNDNTYIQEPFAINWINIWTGPSTSNRKIAKSEPFVASEIDKTMPKCHLDLNNWTILNTFGKKTKNIVLLIKTIIINVSCPFYLALSAMSIVWEFVVMALITIETNTTKKQRTNFFPILHVSRTEIK